MLSKAGVHHANLLRPRWAEAELDRTGCIIAYTSRLDRHSIIVRCERSLTDNQWPGRSCVADLCPVIRLVLGHSIRCWAPTLASSFPLYLWHDNMSRSRRHHDLYACLSYCPDPWGSSTDRRLRLSLENLACLCDIDGLVGMLTNRD